ncbi:uncharacterized protein LOC143462329 [Clavelina lepadiformis]|uniref:Phospholipid scramblase n=1 Tax=Clavelina lepadiformis TaxID=159417 RepID=A0ABP0GL68_CLALP
MFDQQVYPSEGEYGVSTVLPPASYAQPGKSGWAPMPLFSDYSSGCPPGLQALIPLDRIEFTRKTNDQGLAIKGTVKNMGGMKILKMKFHRSGEDITQSFYDNTGSEVLRCNTKAELCGQLCPCCCCLAESDGCGTKAEIEAPLGHTIAKTKQKNAWCAYEFKVKDGSGDTKLIVKGTLELEIETKSGKEIGKITAKQDKPGKITRTIKFPADLDIKMKAALLCF